MIVLAALALACCAPSGAAGRPAAARPMAVAPSVDVNALGQRIWRNECAGSVKGLVSWNDGEDFPSLGIGHFIWYPAGVQGPFAESLPQFVRFARSQGVHVPSDFDGPAPWPNKRAFLADRSGKADRMRSWLAGNVRVQTLFIIARSRAALGQMLRHTRQPQAVQARYRALSATTQGMYCLVDYVNFKGEGTKPEERYRGQGWGLLQVLEEMEGNPQGRAATAEFSRAASTVMRRRVANSPAARNEKRWLPGWLNRCATYK